MTDHCIRLSVRHKKTDLALSGNMFLLTIVDKIIFIEIQEGGGFDWLQSKTRESPKAVLLVISKSDKSNL